MDVLCDTSAHAPIPEVLPNKRAMEKVQSLYEGKGRGADLLSARGTAWGLLNAVTEYVITSVEPEARSIEWIPPGLVKVQRSNRKH